MKKLKRGIKKVSKYIFLLLFAASISIIGCSKERNEDPQINKDVNVTNDEIKAPAFSLISTDGKKINLADYKGKIVILDFWATWCGPCRRGVPDLVSIQKEFKDQVTVIGISLDHDATKGDIIPFMNEFSVNYPVVYGTSEVVANYGNIQAIPTSFIINEEGFIVDQYVGLVPKEMYLNKIKSLLKES
jgi:cytochrome c biogenesis protein CcmG/thiol:disulfide interchange protein DsbE